MFYTLKERICEVPAPEGEPERLTVGYVSAEELKALGVQLGFASSTIAACQTANRNFRSGVEVHSRYTFTELRVLDSMHPEGKQDCVALYFMKNLFLVVDVEDRDGSTKEKFTRAMQRCAGSGTKGATLEKMVYSFLELLVSKDRLFLENVGNEITALEETVFNDEADDSFNVTVLHTKRRLLALRNYYNQILDITEAIDENENGLFAEENMMYISNLAQKVTRLREDADSLSSSLMHLQDAYSSFMDAKMNRSMKLLTVITTIFFPLTIIVGWYGMNFDSMPEFHWKFGYLFVILLSVAVVVLFGLLAKKRKWL